jgi:hypothetical protein
VILKELLALIVDESRWLPASMGLALAAVALLLYRHRRSDLPSRRRVAAAMNLFFGITIGTMAFGHLSAVTTKLAMGTLEGSVVRFYAIGVVLALPSWWLICHALGLFASNEDRRRVTWVLNVWLAVSLLALGLLNLPLAAPAFFNIGYHFHTRRAVGWAMVAMAVIFNVGLFVGALKFMASGQSFEQFSGVE